MKAWKVTYRKADASAWSGTISASGRQERGQCRGAERVVTVGSVHKTHSIFDRYRLVSPADFQEAAQRLAVT